MIGANLILPECIRCEQVANCQLNKLFDVCARVCVCAIFDVFNGARSGCRESTTKRTMEVARLSAANMLLL